MNHSPSRRTFIAGALGAAAAPASLLPPLEPTRAAQPLSPEKRTDRGYHVTPHIRTYYDVAFRF